MLAEDAKSIPQVKYIVIFLICVVVIFIAIRRMNHYLNDLEKMSFCFYSVKLYRERNNM
mgnify:CR=1 FL=1